jgi:hypothetical protein
MRIQYRAELFNAFNDTNFSNTNSSFGDQNLGVITATETLQRTIQFGLKFVF